MMRLLVGAVTGFGMLAVSNGTAQAQYTPFGRPAFTPFSQPTLSPYLNMLRGGNPAANYYLGVIPERYQRSTNALLQSEIYQLERTPVAGIDPLEAPARLSATGHTSQFMNYAPYYNINNNLRFNPANLQRNVPALPGQRLR